MIVKFLLLTCCAATLAQVTDHEYTLVQLLAKGQLRVIKVDETIADPTEEYLDLIEDRREAVEWEHNVQTRNMKDSMTKAMIKGMLRNNKYNNFQCIADAAQDTFAKINASSNSVENITTSSLEKGLEEVKTLGLITSGLFDYVIDLYHKKKEELNAAKNDKEKDKIVEKAEKKMELLETILRGVENRAKEIKYKFFENYVKYAFATENYLRKTAREGAQKAFKCVS